MGSLSPFELLNVSLDALIVKFQLWPTLKNRQKYRAKSGHFEPVNGESMAFIIEMEENYE